VTVAELIEEFQRMPSHWTVLVESLEWHESTGPVPMYGVAHASIADIEVKHSHVILNATGGIL
jgi:hypothetical protein